MLIFNLKIIFCVFQEDHNEYSYVEQERNEKCPCQVAIGGTPLPSLATCTRKYDTLSKEAFNEYSYIPRELAQRHRQLVCTQSLIYSSKNMEPHSF